MKKAVLAAVIAIGFTQPVAAQKWPDLQNWHFIEGSDYCEMATFYGENDNTRLGIAVFPEGKTFVGAASTLWEIEKDKAFTAQYSIMEGAANDAAVTGWVSGGYKGFIAHADTTFVDALMKFGFFAFKIADAGITDDLDVSGSDQAYAQLKA